MTITSRNVTAPDHLPECMFNDGLQTYCCERHNPGVIPEWERVCICDRLRACERRAVGASTDAGGIPRPELIGAPAAPGALQLDAEAAVRRATPSIERDEYDDPYIDWNDDPHGEWVTHWAHVEETRASMRWVLAEARDAVAALRYADPYPALVVIDELAERLNLPLSDSREKEG